MILGDIYERNARLNPDGVAVVCGDHRVTHSEFLQRARAVARALSRFDKGARVAILARNCIEFLEIQAACEIGGLIGVGLNFRLSVVEIAGIVRDCQPSALFFEVEFSDVADAVRSELEGDGRAVAIGRAELSWADPYERLHVSAQDERPRRVPAPSDIAHFIYTSGTTGRPKGAMLNHESLIAAARMTAHEGGAQPTDRMLLVMPLFHVGAKIEQLAFGSSGATIVLHRAFEPKIVVEDLAGGSITAAHLAPVLIGRIVEAARAADLSGCALRCVHYSASPMPEPLLREAIAIFGKVFVQIFGSTECTVCTILKPHQHILEGSERDVGRLASAGQEFFGSEVRAVRNDGSICSRSEVGEIHIRSPGVMSGYWRQEDVTAATLRNGWLATGDVGYLDENDFLFLVDRKKDVIVTGGENVYSREVEDALRRHEGIMDAAVIGVPDDQWGEAVKAFVICKPGSTATAQEVETHCRALIAGYKRPRIVEFVSDFPRLASGKVDKKALRAPYWAGRSRFIN